MLKRIYIDNYKCLVNFEVQLNQLNLFLGENGSGKSTVFEALRKLQTFISGESKLDHLFLFTDRCRWQTALVQTFELELIHPENNGLVRYHLVIEHTEEGDKTWIKEEGLSFQGSPLFSFELGEVQLFRDDHSPGPKYPFDWARSGLAAITPRSDNKRLTWFKNQIRNMVITQIIPSVMQEEASERGESIPAKHLENFVSWYRILSQDQGSINRLTKVLQEVLEGFDSFKFDPYGARTILQTRFFLGSLKTSVNFSFSELSDGQRMLITLYSLFEAARQGKTILCLDEPENFVSLSEIQPWLNALRAMCDTENTQALLISHHPEMIDLLASHACWFERSNGLATRIHPLPTSGEGDLRVSELIARRWLDHE